MVTGDKRLNKNLNIQINFFVSGGPIQIGHDDAICVYDIVGVTSFGCAICGKLPAVYTKVWNFRTWIEKIVWPSGYQKYEN